MDLLEVFISGRYHRNKKILKMLASNWKFMTFLENDKLKMIGGIQMQHFLR